jgi:hypothetical protein
VVQNDTLKVPDQFAAAGFSAGPKYHAQLTLQFRSIKMALALADNSQSAYELAVNREQGGKKMVFLKFILNAGVRGNALQLQFALNLGTIPLP